MSGMDDVDPKGIDSIPSDVIAINSGNQNFSFVIVDEQSSDHPAVKCLFLDLPPLLLTSFSTRGSF